MKRLLLHVGAHRTATTHFQAVLEANREAMAEAGYVYVPTRGYRIEFGSPLLNRNAAIADAAKKAFEEKFNTPGAVISDENILGTHYKYSSTGEMYPRLLPNVRKMLSCWSGEVVIYLSIRGYADWIESCYLQRLRRGAVQSFEDFAGPLNFETVSWESVVTRLLRASRKASLVVWPYEYYRNHQDDVFDFFGQELGVPLSIRTTKVSNPSISEAAMRILLASQDILTDRADMAKLQTVFRSLFTIEQGYPKPVLIDDSRRRQLDEKYRVDCAAILALIAKNKRVRCLGFDSVTGSP